MGTSDKKIVALLMITIILISSFAIFSSFMVNLNQISFRYEEKVETQEAKDTIEFTATSGHTLNPEGGENPEQPLFYVMESSPTRYIKTVTCNEYDGELWRFTEDYNRYYSGGSIGVNGVKNYRVEIENSINIDPVTRFAEGFIPTSTYTTSVEGFDSLSYYPEENIFYSNDGFSHKYTFDTKQYMYREEVLNDSETIDDDKYLQLPVSISPRIYGLAEDITDEHPNPFQKVVAIQEYLKENYEYDADYERSPNDHEPTDWFLFEEEKGVCANFNSAMSVLARAAGVPTRMVKGYKIADTDDWRTVNAGQAHSWVEVGLECGWINFDATPGSDCGNCIYESDQGREGTKIDLDIPDEAYPGEDFTIDIELTDEDGNTISGQNLTLSIESNHIDGNESVYKTTENISPSDIELEQSLPYTGKYSIKVTFNGSEYYESSTATEVIDIDHITFDLRTDKVFVRNTNHNPDTKKVHGYVFDDGRPMEDTDIRIEVIDPENNETYRGPFSLTSDNEGHFEFDYYMETDSKLGKMRFQYEHLDSGVIKNQTVYFKSPVNIDFYTSQTYDELKINTDLKDDMGNNISGQDVVIFINSTDTGRVRESFESSSNEEGEAIVVINDPSNKYFKEPIKIEVVSKSSDSYTRNSDKDTFIFEKMRMGPITYIGDKIDEILKQYWHVLILIIFASSLSIGLKNVVDNKNLWKKSRDIEEDEKETIKICLEQIDEKLPYVWIVDEYIDIEIEIEDHERFNKLEVYIEGEKVKETIPDKRHFDLHHVFRDKGVFDIKVILDNQDKIEKDIKIEIVDHKKGIQVVYSDLLERLKDKGFDIRDEDTPGNIERLMIDELGHNESIREIKKYMEKAKYSYYDLDRNDFKNMMENMNKLGELIED